MTVPGAPAGVSIGFIGEKIEDTITILRARQQELPKGRARDAVEDAISKLKATSIEIQKESCGKYTRLGYWFMPAD